VIIPTNSGSCGNNGCLTRDRNLGVGRKVVGERNGACWVLWSFCVFECTSTVVVVGACARGCKGLGLCTVGIVSKSVCGGCVGERDSVVSIWGKIGDR
jgi:hypothetical protein